MKEISYKIKAWLFFIASIIGVFYSAVTAMMMGWLTVFAENATEIERLHLKASIWGGLFWVCLILSVGQIFALRSIYKKGNIDNLPPNNSLQRRSPRLRFAHPRIRAGEFGRSAA